MPGRVVHFPLPDDQHRIEPIHVRWVMTGWRELPDGTVVETNARTQLIVRPDGTWTASTKQTGRGLWRHVHGKPTDSALEYFQSIVGMQFSDSWERGDGTYAIGAVLGMILTLL